MAQEEGASYLGVGSIFPTTTKEGVISPTGYEILREIKERIKIPIIAIGGINLDNLHLPLKAGADGIAVVSAIMRSEDLSLAVREFKKRIYDQTCSH